MRSAQRYIEGTRYLRLLTPDVSAESDNKDFSNTPLHFLDESFKKRKGSIPSWVESTKIDSPLVLDHYWNSVCKLPMNYSNRRPGSKLPPAKGTLSLEQIYGVVCKEKLFPIKNPLAAPLMLGKQDGLSDYFIYAVSSLQFTRRKSSFPLPFFS